MLISIARSILSIFSNVNNPNFRDEPISLKVTIKQRYDNTNIFSVKKPQVAIQELEKEDVADGKMADNGFSVKFNKLWAHNGKYTLVEVC